jgi:hypothetical protein
MMINTEHFLIGLKLDEVDKTIEDFAIEHERIRMIEHGQAMSCEFNPTRLNIEHKYGIVTDAFYG